MSDDAVPDAIGEVLDGTDGSGADGPGAAPFLAVLGVVLVAASAAVGALVGNAVPAVGLTVSLELVVGGVLWLGDRI